MIKRFSIITVSVLALLVVMLPVNVRASAWAGWAYRVAITVTNPVANYQTKMTIGYSSGGDYNCGGLCNVDFSDIRFTGADGVTQLSFWIESYTASSSAVIWVKDDATPSSTIYMYYDNPAVTTSTSSGTNTFIFFDDCNNLTNWTVSSGTVTNANSIMSVTSAAGSGGNSIVYTNSTFAANTAIRTKMATAHNASTTRSEDLRWIVVASGNGSYAWFDYSGATYPGKFGNYNSGWGTLYSITGWSANVYHIVDMIRNGTTSTILNVDGANTLTATDKLTSGSLAVGYQANSSSYDALTTVDWLLVRSWTSTEPTLSFGSAELVPYTNNGIGVVMMGRMVAGEIYTTGLTAFTFTNSSPVAVDVTISGTDMTGGNTWTLSDTATPGSDIYGLKAGLSGGDYTIVVKKTATYNTLVSNLAVGASQQFGLKFYVPTAIDDGIVKNSTVTLNIVAH